MSSPIIGHISDLTRWAAVYRARETERKKPLFRDPFARRLAGERGEQIANATPFHEKHSWSWVTRTYFFDSIIREQVAQGADMVVNLAAGLDARPYRMPLPPSRKWIEVDLPEIPTGPDHIVLYQKNIEAVCSSGTEVRHQIRQTLIHELGHYFGMTEEQLKDV